MVKVAAMLAVPFLLVGALASSSCLVVDVKEGGPDAVHIVVPIPLALAQVALGFVPAEHTRVPCPDGAEYIPLAERMVEELEAVSDSELVRVEEEGELVVISKVEQVLRVEVYQHGGDEVQVAIPIGALRDILTGFDGESFEASQIVSALRGISRTDLVYVRDGDEEVKIWVW